MKKIGILTFHDEPNYGAFLQTYALSECLKDRGFDVEVIDLRIKETLQFSFLVKLLSPVIRYFIFEKARKKYLNRSKIKYYSSKEIKKNTPFCDIYLLGSDQVWNKDVTGELKYSYFFDFLPDSIPRLSYASSFGMDKWNFDNNETEKIKILFSKFSAVSVREKSAVVLCKHHCGINATLVVDPTLLLSDYSKLTGKIKVHKKRVVCFKFNKGVEFYEFLRLFKGLNNYKISILNKTLPQKQIGIIPLPTIKKWVKSIAESEIVITDSYHALIFSIIYKKMFIVMPANEKNFNRLSELLSDLGLEDRIFYSYDEVLQNDRWTKEIDYHKVHEILSLKMKDSLSFLINELNTSMK